MSLTWWEIFPSWQLQECQKCSTLLWHFYQIEAPAVNISSWALCVNFLTYLLSRHFRCWISRWVIFPNIYSPAFPSLPFFWIFQFCITGLTTFCKISTLAIFSPVICRSWSLEHAASNTARSSSWHLYWTKMLHCIYWTVICLIESVAHSDIFAFKHLV